MTCTGCHQPIHPCASHGGCEHGGWLHTRTGLHACGADWWGEHHATPDPAQLPTVVTPASRPQGEVA